MRSVVIIGGGASGFFCAANLAMLDSTINITILEKHHAVLQKVKVSGGGRCNVTHDCELQSKLVKNYPRGKNFLKKSFELFSTKNTIEWFAQQNVTLKIEADGRMFPTSNSSQTIIDCLLNICSRRQVALKTHCEVLQIQKKEAGFLIHVKEKESIKANYVMIACGGFNKIAHYEWIKSIGHQINPPLPSLFTFNIPKNPLNELMGISVADAEIKIATTSFQEKGIVLITHWGLSGPAVLKLSAFAAKELANMNYHFNIMVNWINKSENDIRKEWNNIRDQQGSSLIGNKNPFALPNRLWQFILQQCGINEQSKWSELASKEQNKLIHMLTTHTLSVSGKTTFKEEFVICGGVSMEEVNPKNMESNLVPHLFFGGEVLDVDGITGGFNFQHAWTSGYLAAKGIYNAMLTL